MDIKLVELVAEVKDERNQIYEDALHLFMKEKLSRLLDNRDIAKDRYDGAQLLLDKITKEELIDSFENGRSAEYCTGNKEHYINKVKNGSNSSNNR